MARLVAVILGVVLLAVAVPWLLMGVMMPIMMGGGVMGGTGAVVLASPIIFAGGPPHHPRPPAAHPRAIKHGTARVALGTTRAVRPRGGPLRHIWCPPAKANQERAATLSIRQVCTCCASGIDRQVYRGDTVPSARRSRDMDARFRVNSDTL